MINFDFLVAGCNTRCQHCYVNGGPGPMMPLANALTCLERLDALASCLHDEVSFTLDHEPINHPQIDQILRAAHQTQHIQNYHHGMTTGIALMHRADQDAVIQAYLDCGYRTFGITVHGSAARHDEIVRRKGAYDAALAAAACLKEHGAKVEVSLMLNRYFVQDAPAITAMLAQLQPDSVYFAMPIFTPHRNMLDFEPHRATTDTIAALRGYLTQWRQDETAVLQAAEHLSIGSAVRRLKQGISWQSLFAQKQDELYLSLHPDCQLYIGNSGSETRCLGDLRTLDLQACAALLNTLPGNRDYGAYYDEAALPPMPQLITELEQLPQNLVYGDFESILYRGLTALNTPTRLL